VSTSERSRVRVAVALVALAALAALVALVACGQAGECMRFSDCAVGQACSAGVCVDAAPGPADGSTTDGPVVTGDDSGATSVGMSGDEADDDADVDATAE
jgi:hypothetical protein